MTGRGRVALALGLATYLAAWAFGSRALYPVATGILLAVVLAWLSVHLAARPMRFRRLSRDREHVEGDDVRVGVELEPEGNTGLASATLVEWIVRLGERRTLLVREGRFLRGGYILRSLPRGRYALAAAHVVVEDPFGLQEARVQLDAGGALLVYPRLVELERLFSESGAHAHDGRRLLLRRPTGFDLHSVREYQQGESLRRVHWRTTARRGQLMVKELEDAPRDEIAVLLDADARAIAGTPPDSSFDLQVRAAGSILLSHVRRKRRSALIVNSALRETQRVHSADRDWRLALEVLAAVEATGQTPVAALLAEEESLAARALELTVVTARLAPDLVDRLVHRALARRAISVVYVDLASFNGAPKRPDPALLRLQATGVPLVVLRRGDDLRRTLGGAEPLGVASG
jgi:uncharacterized protein (DUF58 family)